MTKAQIGKVRAMLANAGITDEKDKKEFVLMITGGRTDSLRACNRDDTMQTPLSPGQRLKMPWQKRPSGSAGTLWPWRTKCTGKNQTLSRAANRSSTWSASIIGVSSIQALGSRSTRYPTITCHHW
jgi:hypothetical protein